MSSTAAAGAVTEPATIPEALRLAVERAGERAAVVDDGGTLSYRELAQVVRTAGAGLVAHGVAPGDRIALWAPNSAEWIVTFLALSSVGATLVPINTRFKGPEAAEILRRAEVRVLFTAGEFLGTDHLAELAAAGGGLPALERIVVIGEPGSARRSAPTAAPTLQVLSFEELLGAAREADLAEFDRRRDAVSPQDPADIIFTSGTTGVPKGVVQTHAGTMAVALDWVAMTGLGPDDRYLMVNPYFHMFGLKAGILASLCATAAMYPVAVFDTTSVLDAVERHRITVLPGAPTLYHSLLEDPGVASRDLSSLRIAVTGAADIPVALIGRVIDELPFERVLSGYGLSEGGTASATEPGDSPEIVATTVGRARPGVEIRVVDASGAVLGPDEAGEIQIRGRTVMSHYLDDPTATAAALDEQGWLATGDVGILGDDGRLRIVGRVKDMFIVGGFNAYPAEIENLLTRHPEITQAAVVGVPDKRLGEVGVAFVVTGADSAMTPEEIIDWARGQMANYKVPRRVEIIDELPLNAAGKIEKLVLKERATK